MLRRQGADVKTDPTVTALRAVNLFSGLDERTLSRIAQQTKPYRLRAGESVIDEDASGRFGRLYTVVSGTAEARVHDEAVATFGPGDYFGEMSVLDGSPPVRASWRRATWRHSGCRRGTCARSFGKSPTSRCTSSTRWFPGRPRTKQCSTDDPSPGQSWIHTVERSGSRFSPQIRSITGFATRMHPCDAG